jgi:CheY-like chemotaxis protein
LIWLKRILVVDDEEDTVRLTQRILETEGFDVVGCNSGNKALDWVQNNYNDVSLILLDIMMPGKSGFEVLKTIKTDEKLKSITVILFTIKNFNEDLQKAKKLGADGYLIKPFSGTQLISYIKEKLSVN